MQRLHPDWSIARVAWVIYEPQSTEEELSELRATKAAAPAWRLHLEAARSARIARRFRNLYWHIRENEIVQQSNTIKSFVFEPTDGNRVLPHRPDQYLTLRFTPGGRTSLLIWTYSFAATSNGRNYAISVKREGEGSAGCTTMSALAPKSRSASPEASSFSINKPVSAPDHLGRRRHRAAPCRPTSRWKSVTPSDERPASPQ
jgi:hypothetical protein